MRVCTCARQFSSTSSLSVRLQPPDQDSSWDREGEALQGVRSDISPSLQSPLSVSLCGVELRLSLGPPISPGREDGGYTPLLVVLTL